ncbi:hypothetical protein T439DRAFT_321759 [Meredithblackwellia eburnea MCA 4105]
MDLLELDHRGGQLSSPGSNSNSSSGNDLDFDLDLDVSSSSASGDHSSPEDSSNEPSPNFNQPASNNSPPPWQYDIPSLVDGIALTGDFWSTAPSTTVHSPAASANNPATPDDAALGATAQNPDLHLDLHNQLSTMQVDFDDVVHGHVCGPSSVPSPQAYIPSNSLASFSHSNPITPSGLTAHPPQESSLFLSALSMAMPLDLLAVNAGIAPQLTSADPSPPLDASNELADDVSSSSGSDLLGDRDRDSSNGSRTRESNTTASESGGSRATSLTRPPAPVLSSASSSSTTKPSSTTSPVLDAATEALQASTAAAAVSAAIFPQQAASTNLVAKDAVVASTIITSLTTPSRDKVNAKLLVLGVPTIGAKSRVETQIKISLVLVAQKQTTGPRQKVKLEDQDADDSALMTLDGGLADHAGDRLERIGSWSHVKLPRHLALKKKNKKQSKEDPPPEDTLFLDVAVVRGSEPYEEIFICTGCQQRELKRAQRKKDARVKPENGEVAYATYGMDEDDERKKVVLFNCSEYVEFGAGETVLPTRITCYCRHHKERKGFSVAFSLKTAAGVVVASGTTPPIMITDDHKTSVRPPPGGGSNHSANVSADTSFDAIDPVVSSKVVKKSRPSKDKKDRPSSESASSSRSKRTGGSSSRPKSARGSPESDDDLAPGSGASTPARVASGIAVGASSATGAAKKQSAQAKPYDSDSRPRKRQSGVHRSPSFAMTPLVMSKPGSPVLRPVPDSAVPSGVAQATSSTPAVVTQQLPVNVFQTTPAVAESDSWETALGLGGMGDAVMQDVPRHDSIASMTFSSNGGYSTAPSNAPSPAQSADWRSNASSPSIHSNDAFPSIFNGLNASPLDLSNLRSGLISPPVQSQQPDPLARVNGNDFAASLAAFGTGAGQSSALNWSFPPAPVAPPPPRISRLIPGEGPCHGGIEVTVLGENFVRDLTVVFGDTAAVPTHYWSSNTLVCVLPPSANPGPVVVGIKGVPLTVEQGTGLQLFTYKDDSDRNLLELALQVVGLKMTGRLEDASAVAMRIVGTSANTSANNSPSASRSPTDSSVLAGMAAFSHSSRMRASQPSSRQASYVNVPSLTNSPNSSSVSLPPLPFSGETRNFEGIVIKFLSLLDLDPSDIPGAAPSVPLSQPPISYVNAQRHSLLHLATVLGFHRLVQFLLARGIDVNSRDRNGFTPLHFAALYGRVAITRLLLDAGAKPYPRNLAGKTPLDIARQRDDVDVEEVFLRSGRRPSPERRPHLVRAPSSSSSYTRHPAPQAPVFDRRAYTHTRATYSDESSADESESEDDRDSEEESFHTSDEDEWDESDVERRLSRNPSMVSLHYLLEAEQDVDAEYEYDSPPPSFSVSPSDDELDLGRPLGLAASLGDVKQPLPTNTGSGNGGGGGESMDDLANAAGNWLSRSLKGTPRSLQLAQPATKKPLAPIQHAWEKVQVQSNGVWEKMRLHPSNVVGGFQLQMPEPLAAFQATMTTMPAPFWRGRAKSDSEGSEASAVTTKGKEKEKSAWWTRHSPNNSPPPLYTPTDTLLAPVAHPQGPIASTSSAVSENMVYPPAKLKRRSGGRPPSSSVSSTSSDLHSFQEQKPHRLRDDMMLAFFWLPILIIVSVCAIYNYETAIQPLLYALADAVQPLLASIRS